MGARLRILPRYGPPPGGSGGYPAPSADTAGWIRYTPAGTRTGSLALHGATIGDTPVSVWASTAGTAGSSTTTQVTFVLDGTDLVTDTVSPFDAYGADADGIPLPLPDLLDGSHVMGIRVDRADGTKHYVQATFTASGMAGGGGGGGGTPSTMLAALGTYKGADLLAAQMGTPVRFRTDFASWREQSWSSLVTLVQTRLADSGWRNGTYTKVLAIGMLPDPARQSGQTLAAGAAGSYDSYVRQIRDVIKAVPAQALKRLVIRLGWEFNGSWYPFTIKPSGSTQAQRDALADAFAAFWRRWHTIIMDPADGLGADSGVLWDWCPVGPALTRDSDRLLTERAWPGAAWVDVVSTDFYCNYPGQNAAMMRQALDWVTNWAITKSTPGKALLTAVDETSVGAILNLPTGTTWEKTWSSTTAYQANDVVVHDDALIYMALAGSTGVEPGTAPSTWRRIYVGRGTWSAGTYAKGDVVAYNGDEYVSNVDGNTTTPGSTSWRDLHNGGYTDYPEYATELTRWEAAEATAGRLHHLSLWEYDTDRERTFYAIVNRLWIWPGRDNWQIGRLPAATTSGSNQVGLSGDGGGGFDSSDVGETLTGTGIPAGVTITAVNAAGTVATISANATATGSPQVTIGGIRQPGNGCNFPRVARRLVRLMGA